MWAPKTRRARARWTRRRFKGYELHHPARRAEDRGGERGPRALVCGVG